MRDYKEEFEKRIAFIQKALRESGAKGIVYGNSGGKDSALVGALCKAACDNTVGIIMPCASKRNFDQDAKDGAEVAEKFGIETRTADLTELKKLALEIYSGVTKVSATASANIGPRLRMMTLYAVAQAKDGLLRERETEARATWATSPNGATEHMT